MAASLSFRRVVVDGLTVGWFGQLHPSEAAARKIKNGLGQSSDLYPFSSCPLRKPVARDISRFQPVRRDFSLVLDESIEWERSSGTRRLQIPGSSSGASAKFSRRQAGRVRCCWAPPSRRRTAPCAKKSCKASRRR